MVLPFREVNVSPVSMQLRIEECVCILGVEIYTVYSSNWRHRMAPYLGQAMEMYMCILEQMYINGFCVADKTAMQIAKIVYLMLSCNLINMIYGGAGSFSYRNTI